MADLRKAARGEQCTVLLSVCNGRTDTTVLAHAPAPVGTMGGKSPDTWGAFSCCCCHDALDGRTPWLELCTKPEAWMTAIYRTQERMKERGLL